MKLARIFAAASSGTNSQSTSPAETSYVFGVGMVDDDAEVAQDVDHDMRRRRSPGRS